MKITKAEYDEMIRKRPSLKPAEVIKAPNSGLFTLAPGEVMEFGPFEMGEPNGGKVTVIQQTPLKSPRTLKFTVLGQPVPKPRMTQQDKWRKRPIVMKYWAWAEKARASVPKGVELAVYREVHFKAYLEIPKSYSKSKRALLVGGPHLSRGDCDNFLKALQDSLFKQDCVIWKFSGEKRWDDGQGSRIEVELR